MTDLHTHILPGMDDGAKDVDMSLEMLRMERDQGVNTVVLTPHFYRDRERMDHFLQRRKVSGQMLMELLVNLPEEERNSLPSLIMGAEVAWVPNLSECCGLERLCIGNSRYLLLELPFTPWNSQMFNELYNMMGRTGITPIISHIERYRNIQKKEYLAEVLNFGVPTQISADSLLHTLRRSSGLKMLRERQVQCLASDCHNTTIRPPNLGPALQVVRQKLGEETAASVSRWTDAVAKTFHEP